jgi:dihydroflavonol-4-reductase
MQVLVTGGTGYVGSHSIAALSAAGQRVRVLARSPERIAATLGSLNVDGIEAASATSPIRHLSNVGSTETRGVGGCQLPRRRRRGAGARRPKA